MYDLLIKNAYVLDGTGAEGFHSDIGISGGKIAAMAQAINAQAESVIDASGLTLAPGFIDAHSHQDVIVEEYPECICAVEQGITTQVTGMCGDSAAPVSPRHIGDALRIISSLKGGVLPSPVETRFTFGGYLDHIDKPLGTNMAFLVGHGMIRAAVMGFENRKPDSLSGGQGAVSAQDSAAAIEFLGARGSERVFFREGGKIIVMYDDGNRDENGKYAGHSRWLKAHGIPVPEILFDRPEIKTLAMEFAGVEKKMSLVDYAKVVETLVKFNSLGSEKCLPDLLPPFDDETWEWERMLFEKYCLKAYFGMEMPDAVRKELEGVAEMLEAEPKALVHRDFQSTNVLWKNGELCFIDFQGMRLGPAAYDLASLVYDPYVDFSEKDRAALIALYAKTAKREEFVKVVPFAAVQRLCQCLGAYGRLASVGQPQFKRHVVPALRNLLVAADEAGLDAVGALAEDLLGREMKNSR